MLEVSVSAKGEFDEVASFFKRFATLLDESNHTATYETKPKRFANFVDAVWSQITGKAREALVYIAKQHEGCTKEQIVAGCHSIADTRELGGALSSVARRCQALQLARDVIYVKHGELYGTDDETAQMILNAASATE